ncbi:hypothetical protein ANCCEY_06589 [Ancylostoma ceylanicum]|uniref:Glycosyltransferase family 92 protein n=2 Tax=Ancylostoma ceylanicum TaxID=53326 RepID=A0A0D6LW54_9BILA|nr:hypothetical protein ANCCEY_06589 [Ancylostoma ceylanicum]
MIRLNFHTIAMLLVIGTLTLLLLFSKSAVGTDNRFVENARGKSDQVLNFIRSSAKIAKSNMAHNKSQHRDGSSDYDQLEDIQSCVPFYDIIEKHVKLKTGRRGQAVLTTFSLVGAYEYENYSVVTMEVDKWYGKIVTCRYLDADRNEIKPAILSVVFPEFTVYCCRRKGAYFMSVTESAYDDITDIVPVIDRTMRNPKFTLSLCVKPMYGMHTKFLLFAEFIEHYKLQGVQYFYIYVKDLDEYTRKLIMHYVKSGEAEVVFFREERDRVDIEWHLVGTQDCIHRSRQHSRYALFADLDERILPTKSPSLRDLVSNHMESHPATGMMRFVTQWVLKTKPDPTKYEGYKTLNEHLTTLVCHNTSSPAPIGHTAKCVLDPTKVFLMWVHHVEIYFPGHETYEVPTSDAIIRHYRDVASGNWAKYYLPGVAEFGPFTLTNYPNSLMQKLYSNVKNRLDRAQIEPAKMNYTQQALSSPVMHYTDKEQAAACTLNSLWLAMYPIMSALSVSRILVVKEVISPDRFPVAMKVFVAIGWLYTICVWICGCITQNITLKGVCLAYDLTKPGASTFSQLEWYLCLPSLAVSWGAYFVIVLHTQMVNR